MNSVVNDPGLKLSDIQCCCPVEGGFRGFCPLDFKRISADSYAEALKSKKCCMENCNNNGVVTIDGKLYCKKGADKPICCECEKAGKKFLDYINEWICGTCAKAGKCSLSDIELPDGSCSKKLYFNIGCGEWICKNHLEL